MNALISVKTPFMIHDLTPRPTPRPPDATAGQAARPKSRPEGLRSEWRARQHR
jgi:hypothetical protein